MPEVIPGIDEQVEAAVRAPYTRILRHDPGDDVFVAHVLELPGVIAGGETVEEANDSLDEGIRLWVEHELRHGHEIPAPFDPDQFSGRVTLRMTPFLHERAQLRAQVEGVSLNRLLEIAIASYLGDRLPVAVLERTLAAFLQRDSASLRRIAEDPGPDYQ